MSVIGFHNPDEPYGFLSNWYLSEFTVDGVTFLSMEQYMMFKKAVLFKDADIAAQILDTDDVVAIKEFGRKVSGYNDSVWNGMRQVIIYMGLIEKFRQNEDLLKALLDTGNRNWDIEEKLTCISFKELVNANKLPVATNCSGDHFCIDCMDGSIWFVYHDKPKEVKIADDLKTFIAGCKSKKIGHVRTIEEITQSLLESFGKKPTEFQLSAWQAEIDKYGNMIREEVIL